MSRITALRIAIFLHILVVLMAWTKREWKEMTEQQRDKVTTEALWNEYSQLFENKKSDNQFEDILENDTEQPTKLPTNAPSSVPSSAPSAQPSGVPSSTPTGQPSGHPSAVPSSAPSGQPSGVPSSTPTGQPSGQPSSQPSSQPSRQPSAQPFADPTSQPTFAPTSPTFRPTTGLSRSPTFAPTISPVIVQFQLSIFVTNISSTDLTLNDSLLYQEGLSNQSHIPNQYFTIVNTTNVTSNDPIPVSSSSLSNLLLSLGGSAAANVNQASKLRGPVNRKENFQLEATKAKIIGVMIYWKLALPLKSFPEVDQSSPKQLLQRLNQTFSQNYTFVKAVERYVRSNYDPRKQRNSGIPHSIINDLVMSEVRVLNVPTAPPESGEGSSDASSSGGGSSLILMSVVPIVVGTVLMGGLWWYYLSLVRKEHQQKGKGKGQKRSTNQERNVYEHYLSSVRLGMEDIYQTSASKSKDRIQSFSGGLTEFYLSSPTPIGQAASSRIQQLLVQERLHGHSPSPTNALSLRRRSPRKLYSQEMFSRSPRTFEMDEEAGFGFGQDLSQLSMHSGMSNHNYLSPTTNRAHCPPFTEREVAEYDQIEGYRNYLDYENCEGNDGKAEESPLSHPPAFYDFSRLNEFWNTILSILTYSAKLQQTQQEENGSYSQRYYHLPLSQKKATPHKSVGQQEIAENLTDYNEAEIGGNYHNRDIQEAPETVLDPSLSLPSSTLRRRHRSPATEQDHFSPSSPHNADHSFSLSLSPSPSLYTAVKNTPVSPVPFQLTPSPPSHQYQTRPYSSPSHLQSLLSSGLSLSFSSTSSPLKKLTSRPKIVDVSTIANESYDEREEDDDNDYSDEEGVWNHFQGSNIEDG